MIKLSDRLKQIANHIESREDIADIGTDHGYLPLYLLEQNPKRKAIFADVNEGPLTKAKSIIRNQYPEADINDYDLRQGDGLAPIESGEVDTVIIAGMGGILIRDILAFDINKTKSYEKFILQPRTAADKLRKWLVKEELFIVDEDLAYEKGRICEIIVVKPGLKKTNKEFITDLDYEFSPILINKRNNITKEWIENLINTEEKIKSSIVNKGNSSAKEKLDITNHRLAKLKEIKKIHHKL